MRSATRVACASAFALALSACFAEVEGDSLTYTRTLPVCDATTPPDSCKFLGVPVVLQDLTPLQMTGGNESFTVDLGHAEFLKKSGDLGPATLDNDVTINRATLTLDKSSQDAGASFAGIEQLLLFQVPKGADCSQASACPELAAYDRATDGPVTSEVVLRGKGVNMLVGMTDGLLTLKVEAKGTLPTQNWSATAVLDMSVNARATFP